MGLPSNSVAVQVRGGAVQELFSLIVADSGIREISVSDGLCFQRSNSGKSI
jgi:hypothetical protein